ncbi:MAG: cytochrome c [Deltaproteobacteria bacterium]|nr:cytochrome c [Myxococcales bacterium]TDJ11753.1 MAG: cytochrome c [Deltaproteobacteria bacterium]
MMRIRSSGVWTLVGLMLSTFVACGGGDEGTSQPAPSSTPAPKPEPTPEPGPTPTPEPVVGNAGRGATTYARDCASCHGPTGGGDGALAAALDPKPAAHSDGNVMNGLSDAYLFKVIQQGGAAVGKAPIMAPWGGSLDDAQIWDLVAFIRTLAHPPYEP